MTNIIKSLIAKTRRPSRADETAALSLATQVLQNRVQQIAIAAKADDRAAA